MKKFRFPKLPSDHRIYHLSLLVALLLLQFGVFALVRFVEIPHHEAELRDVDLALRELEKEKNSKYDSVGLSDALAEYGAKIETIRPFQEARAQTFLFAEADKFDFFPNLLADILPTLTRLLHTDVVLEGVSINEKGEIVLPIHGPDYETLAKQYAAMKQAIKDQTLPMLTDIQLNTLSTQEIETIERDRQRHLIKNRNKVIKATVIARLNPAFFQSTETESAEKMIVNEVSLDWGLSNTEQSWWQHASAVGQNIWGNMASDFDQLFRRDAAPAQIEEIKMIEPEPVEEIIEKPTNTVEPEPVQPRVIQTAEVPAFTWQGGTWISVPRVMSSYLAAGKQIIVGDLVIDPYESYQPAELNAIAIRMMNAVIQQSSLGYINFHKTNFDPTTHESDTIDLLQINDL